MARILIAYGITHGSTKEIAQALAEELQAAGHTADAVAIETVVSPRGYDAVVIGGPMYMGRLDGRVGTFVKRHRTDLATVPVAGFALGLLALRTIRREWHGQKKALHAALDPLRPFAEVFVGKLDPAKHSWFQRWITKKLKASDGDFCESHRCLGTGPAREDEGVKNYDCYGQ